MVLPELLYKALNALSFICGQYKQVTLAGRWSRFVGSEAIIRRISQKVKPFLHTTGVNLLSMFSFTNLIPVNHFLDNNASKFCI